MKEKKFIKFFNQLFKETGKKKKRPGEKIRLM